MPLEGHAAPGDPHFLEGHAAPGSHSVHSAILTPIWRPVLTWVSALFFQAAIIRWFTMFMALHSSDAPPPLTNSMEPHFSAWQGQATAWGGWV